MQLKELSIGCHVMYRNMRCEVIEIKKPDKKLYPKTEVICIRNMQSKRFIVSLKDILPVWLEPSLFNKLMFDDDSKHTHGGDMRIRKIVRFLKKDKELEVLLERKYNSHDWMVSCTIENYTLAYAEIKYLHQLENLLTMLNLSLYE